MTVMNQIATSPIPIPSKRDLTEARQAFLDSIAESGRVNDIFALCRERIKSYRGHELALKLPRKLTLDEYECVLRMLEKSGWYAQATLLAALSGRYNKLVIIDPEDIKDEPLP